MPNFNKGKYLVKAIKSVLNQSFRNWKLYIIDDASNDDSVKILKRFKKNKKINIFFLKKRNGPGYCRNIGIKKSRSKFISFLDSDDYWHKHKLKNQLEEMIKKRFKMVYSDYYSFKNNNKLLYSNVPNNFNFKSFIFNSSINTSTLLLKRDIIKNVKFKNLLKHEDYIFKCEIFRKNKNLTAFKTKKIDTFYRILDNSRSNKILKSFFLLWIYNKKFNNLNFLDNFTSLMSISLNSIKKYGLNKLGV